MLVVDVLVGVVVLAATVVDGVSIEVVVGTGVGADSTRAGSASDTAVGDWPSADSASLPEHEARSSTAIRGSTRDRTYGKISHSSPIEAVT
jgi:hypothetical protein